MVRKCDSLPPACDSPCYRRRKARTWVNWNVKERMLRWDSHSLIFVNTINYCELIQQRV
jgi:hypothetical protein